MTKARKLDPRVSRDWDEFVSRVDSQVFHSPNWIRVLADTYGFAAEAVVVGDDAIQAGLVFCALDDIRGRRVVGLPFSDFCDPLVSGPSEWEAVVESLTEYRAPISLRILDSNLALGDSRFRLTKKSRWHGIGLERDADRIWTDLHSAARRAVRKARSSSVTVRAAENEKELRSFFDLHLANRKHKYRLLAQPYAFFEAIWNEFVEPGRGELLVAEKDGDIVAGVLFLDWQRCRYYKFNASDPNHIASRPNDLILWTAIERGSAEGYELIDLGLSDWEQEGLVRYKRKYASEERTIKSVTFDPTGDEAPQPDASEELWPLLTDLFTDPQIPDDITEQAGDAIYRYFA